MKSSWPDGPYPLGDEADVEKKPTPLPWSEWSIGCMLAETLFKDSIVLLNNCNWTGYEADIFVVTPKLRIIDVEIKTSVIDFKRDAFKEKWWIKIYRPWQTEGPCIFSGERHRTHPVKVWKQYYALPADIWVDGLESYLPSAHSGILLISSKSNGSPTYIVKRRAKPNNDAYRLTPENTIAIARLCNVRMWKHRKGE